MKINKGTIILVVVFIFLFQQELFSFGQFYLVNPFNIIANLYLNDIGLFTPIIFLIFIKPINISKLFIAFSLTFLYGFVVFLIKHDSNSSNLGPDLRIFLSFFTGYSLINFFDSDLKKIAIIINKCFIVLNFIIFLQFIFLPDFSTWVDNRIGSESIYNLIGPELLLMPSILLISFYTENLKSIKLSFVNFFIILIYSILFLKTRSMFLIILTSFFIVIYLRNKLKKLGLKNNQLESKKNINKHIYLIIIFLIIGFLYLLKINGDASQMFFDRIGSAAENSTDDTNVQFRLLEPVLVFSDMSFMNFLLGSGLAPEAKLISETGQKYNSMHIGILNLLWRFGLLIFLFWIFHFFKFFKLILDKKIKQNKLGLILIAPSLLIYFILSLVSGGWGVIPFLCLGILLGLYNISKKNNHKNSHS